MPHLIEAGMRSLRKAEQWWNIVKEQVEAFEDAQSGAGRPLCEIEPNWEKFQRLTDDVRHSVRDQRLGDPAIVQNVFRAIERVHKANAKNKAPDFDNAIDVIRQGLDIAIDLQKRVMSSATGALATSIDRTEPLIDTQNRILEELDGEGLTAADIAKRLVLGETTIKENVSKLMKLGRIKNMRGLGYYRPDRPPKPNLKP
jgi:biotin operon repressor